VKNPKTPKDNQAPYGQKERPITATEIRMRQEDQRERRGCGDPNCLQCYPKDGSMGDYRRGGKDDMPNYTFLSEDNFLSFARFVTEAVSDAKKSPPSSLPKSLTEAEKAVSEHILTLSPDLDWSSVVGNEAAHQALREAVEDPIKHAELYAHYAMKTLKGVLLYGPPGCGKTLFGKVAASIIAKLHGKDAKMLSINGASLQSPWVGETEGKIKAFFTYAREYKKHYKMPLTIFIDEADAILPSRVRGMPWAIANVSTFLAEMDGLEESGAFVILATNRPEVIDEALLRDGRCDRKIKIERPSFESAKIILQNHVQTAPLQHTYHHDQLVDQTLDYFLLPDHVLMEMVQIQANGTETLHKLTLAHIMSGAMLVGLVNRAKGIAFRRDLKNQTITGIGLADLREAVDEIVKENKSLSHAYAVREYIEAVGIAEGSFETTRTGTLQ
jgi:SpoVK/Ycf46/Vps4 family AAA+-type ATPase